MMGEANMMKIYIVLVSLVATQSIQAQQHLPGGQTPPTPPKPLYLPEEDQKYQDDLQMQITTPSGTLQELFAIRPPAIQVTKGVRSYSAPESPETTSPGTPGKHSPSLGKAAKILGTNNLPTIRPAYANSLKLSPKSPRHRQQQLSDPLLFTNSAAAEQFMDYIARGDLANVIAGMNYQFVDINQPVATSYGRTPFEKSIDLNQIKIAQHMIHNGAQIYRKNSTYEQQTPFDRAIELGRNEIIKSMLEKNGSIALLINAQNNRDETPLLRAALYGNKELVKFLLEKGALKDVGDKNKITPLMGAAMAGNSEIVQLLLKNGAWPDLQDSNGWTALMWAEKRKKHDVVKALLKASARKDIKSFGRKVIFDRLAAENDKLPVQNRLSDEQLEQQASQWANVTYHDIKRNSQ